MKKDSDHKKFKINLDSRKYTIEFYAEDENRQRLLQLGPTLFQSR